MASDANTKYNSRAAQMYREKIQQLGSAALARHGTDVSACSWLGGDGVGGVNSPEFQSPSFQLCIDSMNSAPSHSPEKKDSDFFTEHTQVSTTGSFPLINALLAKATPFVIMT